MKKKALWTSAFPKQAQALRPENTKAGGIKARSQAETVMMEVYNAIRLVYLNYYPRCKACERIFKMRDPNYSTDVHHTRGKSGWLLIDVRYWLPVCRPCHNWIGKNPDKARKLGLLCKVGQWNNIQKDK